MIETVKKKVTIVTSCDDRYIPFFSVMFLSVIKHISEDVFLEFIILENDISPKLKAEIMCMQNRYKNTNIKFLKLAEHIIEIIDKCKISRWTKEIYFSLLTPYILSEYEKVIFVDCDIINIFNIKELYDIDLGENLVGAARLCGRCCAYKNGFLSSQVLEWEENDSMDSFDKYFNNGVMLMNLKEFRKTYSIEYVLDYIKNQEFDLLDQDCLNCLCQNRVLYIDSGWNWYPYTEKEFENIIKLCPNEVRNYFEEGHRIPKNIHYTTPEKPWLEPFGMYSEYSMVFWKYAKESPFYEELLCKMQQSKIEKNSIFYKYEDKSWSDFFNTVQGKKLYLFGYGKNGQYILKNKITIIPISGIIDNYACKTEYDEIDILSFDQFVKRVKDKSSVVVLISNQQYKTIAINFYNAGFENVFVYPCMDNLTYQVTSRNYNCFIRAMNLFEEQESRYIYCQLINKRIEYRDNLNIKCGDLYVGNMYFYNPLVWKKNYGVYLDIGIESEKISQKFCEFTSNYEKIISIKKFDKAIFKELQTNAYNIGFVRLDTLDNLSVLKIMMKNIEREDVCLAINISRIPNDFWTIPLFFEKYFPKKKLFVRHHSTNFADTILYVK